MLFRFVTEAISFMRKRRKLEIETERDREYSDRTGWTRIGALDRERQQAMSWNFADLAKTKPL